MSDCIAKFEVSGVTTHGSNGHVSENYRTIKMYAVYGDGSEENRSFAAATPSGTIEFALTNPAASELFKPGERYYVEFTRVAPPSA